MGRLRWVVPPEQYTWADPVPTFNDLPEQGGNGEVRVVLSEGRAYVYLAEQGAWVVLAGGSGGGVGGAGFDAWGALNRLHLGLDHVRTLRRPALTAHSERYDAMVDGSGIDWRRSSSVELRDGRLVARPTDRVGFGDDYVVIRGRGRWEEREITQQLDPGAFEYGLTAVAGDGSFDAGIAGVVRALPASGDPPDQITRRARLWQREPDRIIPLSPGGFDVGVSAVVDVWGLTGRFEAGVAGAIGYRRDVVQFATGPLSQVQAADGTFEAGATGVIQRSIRRGGPPVVVSERLELPGDPVWVYAVVDGERLAVAVSRDDGMTWAPLPSSGVVDVTGMAEGRRLRVRAEFLDETRSYLAAWAYGGRQMTGEDASHGDLFRGAVR